jgi:imidazolonepropionase-like amidohydrolase
MYIAGRALSQTGGHGDLRRRTDGENFCICSSALGLMSVIADGKAGVQTAAREQLRQGVDHLKVFLSGGVVSPADPLASAQYTDEELEAIVHEASSWGTLETVLDAGLKSIEIAVAAGVKLGFGTDLLGDFHVHQSEEFAIRARIQEPRAVLHSATAVNAEILGQGGRLGLIAPGAAADLIVVDGNPLEDLGLLQNQGRHLDLIMKGGVLFKRAL